MFGRIARRYDLANHLLSGGADFVTKPVSPVELVLKVTVHLLKARVQRVRLPRLETNVPMTLDWEGWSRQPWDSTKLLALLWCAHHEMLHAGQIGLLRRHLGYPPIW